MSGGLRLGVVGVLGAAREGAGSSIPPSPVGGIAWAVIVSPAVAGAAPVAVAVIPSPLSPVGLSYRGRQIGVF